MNIEVLKYRLQALHRDRGDNPLAADKLGMAVMIEKITDYAAIAGFGIASTPGIVIDGRIVIAGGLPKREDVAKWLAAWPCSNIGSAHGGSMQRVAWPPPKTRRSSSTPRLTAARTHSIRRCSWAATVRGGIHDMRSLGPARCFGVAPTKDPGPAAEFVHNGSRHYPLKRTVRRTSR